MPKKDDYFSELPNELLLQILKISDGFDIVRLSQVSSSFYSAAKEVELWRAKFIEAGCNPTLFQQIQRATIEYAKLYSCFLKVSQRKPANICELITFFVKDYLTWLQTVSLVAVGNDALYKQGISTIDTIYKNKPETVIDALILDMISKLIRIDAKQSEDAYKNFQEVFMSTKQTSGWSCGPH